MMNSENVNNMELRPTLFLITARGGSKGIPKKNIKELCGVPLIHYSINLARMFVNDDCICLSTDDDEIKKCAESINLNVNYMRNPEFATDQASSDDVILECISFYKEKGISFEKIVLLQPTSPLRQQNHIREALDLFSPDLDMIVSVKQTDSNPYTVLMSEDKDGYLSKFSAGISVHRRQDAPIVYEINGAIYIINTANFLSKGSLRKLDKVKKYTMEKKYSVDIDDPIDWLLCEKLIESQEVKV